MGVAYQALPCLSARGSHPFSPHSPSSSLGGGHCTTILTLEMCLVCTCFVTHFSHLILEHFKNPRTRIFCTQLWLGAEEGATAGEEGLARGGGAPQTDRGLPSKLDGSPPRNSAV